jgi:hypothetical protein
MTQDDSNCHELSSAVGRHPRPPPQEKWFGENNGSTFPWFGKVSLRRRHARERDDFVFVSHFGMTYFDPVDGLDRSCCGSG